MEVWTRTQVTAICVTHDVDEAILLADRVIMMTNGPNAQVGKVMHVDLPRPRSRKQLLEHPDYYQYREELLQFLADCDRAHGSDHKPAEPRLMPPFRSGTPDPTTKESEEEKGQEERMSA